MSETKPTYENQPAVSTQTEETPYPFRRFPTIGVRLQRIDKSDATPSPVVEVDEFTPLIDKDEIQAHEQRDVVIRDRYNIANAVIGEVEKDIKKIDTDVHKLAAERIAQAEKAREEHCELIDAEADDMIAAIEGMRRRAKARENSRQNARIVESQEVQERADSIRQSNMKHVQIFQDEISSGDAYQLKLENNRGGAIELYNSLVTRKNQLQQNELVAQDELAHFKGMLFNSEADKDALFEKASRINAKIRREVDLIARPMINDLLIEHGVPQDSVQDLHGLKEAIRDIREGVSTTELLNRRKELQICEENQEHTFDTITKLNDLIEGRKLLISEIRDELEELDLKIAEVRAELDGKMKATATTIEEHSLDAAQVVEAFGKLLHRDKFKLAASSIPGPLKGVWENMQAYGEMMSLLGSDKEEEWEAPDFNMDVLRSLREDPTVASTLSEEQAFNRNIKQGAELLAATHPVKLIGRAIIESLGKVRFEYQINGDTPQ